MRPQLVEDDIAQHLSISERLRRLEQAEYASRLTALESLRGLVKAAIFLGPWSGTTSSDKTITGLTPGAYLVGVQASAYRTATIGLAGTDFYLNSALLAQSLFYTNEAGSHKAGNTSWTVVSITGTTLLVQLRNSAPGGVASSSDGNDYGSVVVIPALTGALF
jgi:hypothetical protein